MKTVYTYEDAVDNGLELLDEKYPGWAKLINVDTLDMEDYASCIVGQLYNGDFSYGLEQLGARIAEHFGFERFNNELYQNEAYRQLGDLWVYEIIKRVEGE